MHSILEVRHIGRRYNKHKALENLHFSLASGDILGLLGHNGAGKTTTLKIIAGILEPTEGSVRLFGKNPLSQAKCREKTAYLPEIAKLSDDLTVTENIYHQARLHNLPRSQANSNTQQAIQDCQLEQYQHQLLKKLSKGCYQRVALACTIVHKPALILLDEPASGLDPIQITQLRKLINKLSQHSAIILSSHMLSEVAKVCNRYIILRQGKQVYCSSEAENENKQQYEVGVVGNNIQWPNSVQHVETLKNQRYLLSIADIEAETLLQQLLANNITVKHFSQKQDTLEQLFIEYSN